MKIKVSNPVLDQLGFGEKQLSQKGAGDQA